MPYGITTRVLSFNIIVVVEPLLIILVAGSIILQPPKSIAFFAELASPLCIMDDDFDFYTEQDSDLDDFDFYPEQDHDLGDFGFYPEQEHDLDDFDVYPEHDHHREDDNFDPEEHDGLEQEASVENHPSQQQNLGENQPLQGNVSVEHQSVAEQDSPHHSSDQEDHHQQQQSEEQVEECHHPQQQSSHHDHDSSDVSELNEDCANESVGDSCVEHDIDSGDLLEFNEDYNNESIGDSCVEDDHGSSGLSEFNEDYNNESVGDSCVEDDLEPGLSQDHLMASITGEKRPTSGSARTVAELKNFRSTLQENIKSLRTAILASRDSYYKLDLSSILDNAHPTDEHQPTETNNNAEGKPHIYNDSDALIRDFQGLLENPLPNDASIVLSTCRLPIPAQVAAARSDYFNAMLDSRWSKLSSLYNEGFSYSKSNASEAVFTDILEFLITGQVVLNPSDAPDVILHHLALVALANELLLDQLERIVNLHLRLFLTIPNFQLHLQLIEKIRLGEWHGNNNVPHTLPPDTCAVFATFIAQNLKSICVRIDKASILPMWRLLSLCHTSLLAPYFFDEFSHVLLKMVSTLDRMTHVLRNERPEDKKCMGAFMNKIRCASKRTVTLPKMVVVQSESRETSASSKLRQINLRLAWDHSSGATIASLLRFDEQSIMPDDARLTLCEQGRQFVLSSRGNQKFPRKQIFDKLPEQLIVRGDRFLVSIGKPSANNQECEEDEERETLPWDWGWRFVVYEVHQHEGDITDIIKTSKIMNK